MIIENIKFGLGVVAVGLLFGIGFWLAKKLVDEILKWGLIQGAREKLIWNLLKDIARKTLITMLLVY